MRVVLTGTPGTGKTTTSEQLPYEVIHLNEIIEREGLWTDRDADRDSLVADVDALRSWLAETRTDETVVVESHLAHLFDADRVVVLRCRPDVLESRLRERGERTQKASENAESEALDVILSEAVRDHGADRVYEIDTTNRTPAEVAAEIEAVVEGRRDPSAGEVDFTDYLHL